jgi:serine/threonine protein kinase
MLQLQDGAVFGGRYKVLKCIGSGGMGAVYLASDPRYDDFLLALKVLYPGIVKTPEARERFRTEIIASYRITHRNVVRAYEFFDDDGAQAYAMEYADRGDLHSMLSQGGLPISEAIPILRQAAAGLNAIHQRGIIHRDLKPENILLTKHGTVKIADFGVARMRGASTTLTQHGAMVGTPKYFPPEYIEVGESDHRGDIYSLGVIGYEMISGTSPFRSESNVSIMLEHMQADRKPLHQVAPHCPPDLAKIINKAMEVGVANRYQNAEEMRQDLVCLEAGKPLIHCSQSYSQVYIQNKDFVSNANNQKNDLGVVKLRQTRTDIKSIKIEKPKNKVADMFWKILAGVVLFSFVLAGLFYFMFKNKAPDLATDLEVGYFDGYVQDLIQGVGDFKIGFWVTNEGVEVLLHKKPCKLTKLDADRKFNCKNHTYELKVDLTNSYSAAGRLRLSNTMRWARWSVVRASSKLPSLTNFENESNDTNQSK